MTKMTTAPADEQSNGSLRPRRPNASGEIPPSGATTDEPWNRSTEEQVTAYDHLWFRRRPIE